MKTSRRRDEKKASLGFSLRGTATEGCDESERPVVVVVTEEVSEEVGAVVLRSRREALVDLAVAEFLRRLPQRGAGAPGGVQVVAVATGGCR